MKYLHFDADAMAKDLIESCIIPTANNIMQDFVDDVSHRLDKFNVKDVDYTVEDAVKEAGDRVVAKCMFFANAIMESYGKGDKMDKDNPALPWYKQSEYWNKLRDSTYKIVGRRSGPYLNIYGENQNSKGLKEGRPTGGDKRGTNAIKIALKQLDKNLDKSLKVETKFFMSSMNFSKYFKFGE